jgi:hypothetical protein
VADATDTTGLIGLLSRAGVEFVVIGGVAATMHGSAHATYDLDILYRRTSENIERLAIALAPLRPYLRGAPAGLPFVLDSATIARVRDAEVRCVTLPRLIALKRAAGRRKNLNVLAELEALLEERERLRG